VSELLSIWLEVGAYKRHAETKLGVLLELLLALGSFLKTSGDNILLRGVFGGNRAITLAAIPLSSLTCALGFVPILEWLEHFNIQLDALEQERAASLSSQIWTVARIARRKLRSILCQYSYLFGWICDFLVPRHNLQRRHSRIPQNPVASNHGRLT
jgi:hypothetical protein